LPPSHAHKRWEAEAQCGIQALAVIEANAVACRIADAILMIRPIPVIFCRRE